MEITTLGIDLAKSVFQVHGVDAEGRTVLKKKLRRNAVIEFLQGLPHCLVGMEACVTAHYWAREIAALGHDVRLIPPAYVKPYVKRQKNDAADAEAICEAVTRPNMRFVPVKTPEQQGVMVMHRTRELLIRQRTMMLNALRSHLAEFGIIAAKGPQNLKQLIADLRAGDHADLPEIARTTLLGFADQLEALKAEIRAIDRQLLAWFRENEVCQRLSTIPGVGVITATAMVATVPDPNAFASGRQFAAFLGLVPRQNSSGGKDRLGRISKMGDGYLRRLLVNGATSVIRRIGQDTSLTGIWVRKLLERKPARVVTVAIANKTARIVWAVLLRGDVYRRPAMG
ncbi:IS110 family transposase [Lutimaribacter sp. EGI FJ00015]|uniref:IS110 family transposase n=1 Tax=Lutimaribacter degradans TaxID=2945989 RepID=A0ACC5ZZK6_9RHOB|nr:IS110 family transposase [Lutimaribacter sp. EGI FJ00013]MCM2563798.1 IS110 family transposase [Lutimaribacter sp. EGI FJ00013]MCO0614985.1 IS110 family transposase [Lutimaribacter sp. EGI FJ00015]MCO0637625.1 IS110 family transposase [Lutimaribacter sp. EGI FJ00014]